MRKECIIYILSLCTSTVDSQLNDKRHFTMKLLQIEWLRLDYLNTRFDGAFFHFNIYKNDLNYL